MQQTLPIDDALPDLIQALRDHRQAVLQAPPGAGKTTKVPLALIDAGLVEGRIIMLEPRRLAARAAAERMAENLGERVGDTVGYRIKGEAKSSNATRIEVVTEGILTRMIQSDPELPGISAIIFDEFHERSLNADLGLALSLEIRDALRDDLIIVVMSATLDTDAVAQLMGGAPRVTSQGQAYPVETRWLNTPAPQNQRYETGIARLIESAAQETEGGILVFLPGEAEIRRTATMLDLPKECAVLPLYGAMPFKDQQKAIQPLSSGRKVVLATSIAETSLTIQDVRVVIDGGRARRARFDPGSGMSRLVTERVTKAEAKQRQGRAGRVAAGMCYRFWTKGEEGGLSPYPPAEIEVADLTGFVLELAMWGTADPSALPFLTQPNAGAFKEAQSILQGLGALGDLARITEHGRALGKLPLHPRLAHMVINAGSEAALMAALLADRDPLRVQDVDLQMRLDLLTQSSQTHPNHDYAVPALKRIKVEARRLAKLAPKRFSSLSPAQMAALAYPDRVGLRRDGDMPRWVLSGGKGAKLDNADPMAGQRLLVAVDLDGHAKEVRIRMAIPITEAELRAIYGKRIKWRDQAMWSKRHRRVIARQQECFGALVLSDRNWNAAPHDQIAAACLDGYRDIGLPIGKAAQRFIDRVELVRSGSSDFPNMSPSALHESMESWLLPHLPEMTSETELRAFDIFPALRAMLDWAQMQKLDELAPSHFETPLGRRIPVSYENAAPGVEVRLQEMFGITHHPTVGPDRMPIRITLLSPAHRPVQVTTDLPGFWTNSYADVRKDMRGRYPKHPWPEDPTEADPTLRAKRRE